MTKTEEKPIKYFCEVCCFKTNDKKDYNKHLLTSKHKFSTLSTEVSTNKTENTFLFSLKKKIRFKLYKLFFFGTPQFPRCDGRCVQSPGTYSPWRADPRLLVIPSSCSRVAENNPY